MRRWVVLAGGVALAIILSKLLLENVLGIRIEPAVESWMARAGTGSALAVVTLLAADLFLPIPSSLIMILSGFSAVPRFGTILRHRAGIFATSTQPWHFCDAMQASMKAIVCAPSSMRG